MPFTPLPRQLPQFTPSTIIGKNSGYNTQQDPNWGSGAVEPIMGFSDIVPDAVKSLTGSDLAATASSFFSPSSFVKRLPTKMEMDVFHGTNAPEWEGGKPSLKVIRNKLSPSVQGVGFYMTESPRYASNFTKGDNLKRTDLPDETIEHKMLDFSKSLYDQSNDVFNSLTNITMNRRALSQGGFEDPLQITLDQIVNTKGAKDTTGEDLWDILVDKYRKSMYVSAPYKHSKKGQILNFKAKVAAGERLREAGIIGNAYQGIKGDKNFVVYDQDTLDKLDFSDYTYQRDDILSK